MNARERVRDGTQIKVRRSTLERLAKMKLVLRMRSYSDVIDHLINEYIKCRARASV